VKEFLVHYTLAAFDFIGAFALLWANQRITFRAGLDSDEARWALIRRFTYIIVTGALFMKGVYRLETIDVPIDWVDGLAQMPILIGLILFPMLRAFDVISQDAFINGHRRAPFDSH
jgi:hypothetical protein